MSNGRPRLRDREEERCWMNQVISDSQAQQFFGRVIFELRDGRLWRAFREESLLPHRCASGVVEKI